MVDGWGLALGGGIAFTGQALMFAIQTRTRRADDSAARVRAASATDATTLREVFHAVTDFTATSMHYAARLNDFDRDLASTGSEWPNRLPSDLTALGEEAHDLCNRAIALAGLIGNEAVRSEVSLAITAVGEVMFGRPRSIERATAQSYIEECKASFVALNYAVDILAGTYRHAVRLSL